MRRRWILTITAVIRRARKKDHVCIRIFIYNISLKVSPSIYIYFFNADLTILFHLNSGGNGVWEPELRSESESQETGKLDLRLKSSEIRVCGLMYLSLAVYAMY
jgi:hypothetical protein